MTETLSATEGTTAAGSAGEHPDAPERVRPDASERQPEVVADLRRTGINPDFWYPVAVSSSVRKSKTFPARFAGDRIALVLLFELG